MSTSLGSSGPRLSDIWRRLTLAIGFVAVAVGTVIAWQTPPTAYEVSIYAATPLPFWIGVSIGFLSAALVTLKSCHDGTAGLAVGLGLMTTIVIGSLPVVRNYRFYGRADPMTHLGWATEMLTGRMRFGDIFYPGGHSTTALLTDVMEVPIERGMLLVGALYFALYALFIPLTARALFCNNKTTVIAAFSSYMILPINQISNGLFFHTYSMATLFFPVFMYILVKHLKSHDGDGSLFYTIDSWNILLVLSGIALIFIHPQLSLNILILLGILVVLHGILRHYQNSFVSDLRSVTGIFVILSVIWIVWVLQFDTPLIVGERVLLSTYDAMFGATQAGESVSGQVDSARSVEATLLELIVKLFLMPAVYCVLASLTVILSLWGSHREANKQDQSSHVDPHSRSIIMYFGFSGLVLGPFFLAHFLGPISHLFFRHYGFFMLFAVVLGAVTIHRLGELIPGGRWQMISTPVVISLLVIALALSLSTVFASPYIYSGSHHVSDQHLNGYETAIEYSSDEVQWSGIRKAPYREFDALVPNMGAVERSRLSVAGSTSGNKDLQILLSREIAEARYLPVSKVDVDREVIAYRELRYSEESFELIGKQTGVHHIQDNGEFDLYYVTPQGSETEPEENDV